MSLKLQEGVNMNLAKLKGKIREKDKTYEQCAKAINRTPATFCAKMNGKAKFFIDELEKLGDYLEMDSAERNDIFLN